MQLRTADKSLPTPHYNESFEIDNDESRLNPVHSFEGKRSPVADKIDPQRPVGFQHIGYSWEESGT
jgi:hypothetical protein